MDCIGNLRTASSSDSTTVSSFSSTSSIQSSRSNSTTQSKSVRFCDQLPSSTSFHRPQFSRVKRVFPIATRSPKEQKSPITRIPLDPPSTHSPCRKTDTTLRAILENRSTSSSRHEIQTSVRSNNGGTISRARIVVPDSTSQTTIVATTTTTSLDRSSLAQAVLVDKLMKNEHGGHRRRRHHHRHPYHHQPQQSIDFYDSTRRTTTNNHMSMVWKSMGLQKTTCRCTSCVMRKLVCVLMTMMIVLALWYLPSSSFFTIAQPLMEMEDEELLHRLRVIEFESGC